MAIEIAAEELRSAANLAALAPSRSGIVCSEMIKMTLDKGWLTFELASEIQTHAKVRVKDAKKDEKFSVYLDRSILLPFVAVDTKSTYFIEITDKQAHFKCGKRKASFALTPEVQGYADLGDKDGRVIDLKSDALVETISFASAFSNPDPSEAQFNSVHLHPKHGVLAANSRAIFISARGDIKTHVALPVMLVKVLKSQKHLSAITVGKNFARIDATEGYIAQAVNRKALDSFPLDAVVKVAHQAESDPVIFKVSATLLSAAVHRLSGYVAGVIKRGAAIRLSCAKDDPTLTLVCKIPQGRFLERVKLVSPAGRALENEITLSEFADFSEGVRGDIVLRFNPTYHRFALQAKKSHAVLVTPEIMVAE